VSSRLWKAVVRPALTHGAKVYLPAAEEKCLNYGARTTLGVSKTTATAAVRGTWDGGALRPTCDSEIRPETGWARYAVAAWRTRNTYSAAAVGWRECDGRTAHLFEKLIDKGYDSTVRALAWGGTGEWLRVRLGVCHMQHHEVGRHVSEGHHATASTNRPRGLSSLLLFLFLVF
jgi:hypothetical protein